MKCQHCGNERIKEKDNFCSACGKKLKAECNCWIKKDSYNCGEDSCPGWALLVKEARTLKNGEQVHSRNRLQIDEEHQR